MKIDAASPVRRPSTGAKIVALAVSLLAAFVSSKSPFRGSAIYRMLSHARWQRKQGARFQSGMQANGDVPRRYLLYEDQPAPPWDAAWRSFERVVEEFSSEALAHGARYVLLNVPAGQVVNRDAWQAWSPTIPPWRSEPGSFPTRRAG